MNCDFSGKSRIGSWFMTTSSLSQIWVQMVKRRKEGTSEAESNKWMTGGEIRGCQRPTGPNRAGGCKWAFLIEAIEIRPGLGQMHILLVQQICRTNKICICPNPGRISVFTIFQLCQPIAQPTLVSQKTQKNQTLAYCLHSNPTIHKFCDRPFWTWVFAL